MISPLDPAVLPATAETGGTVAAACLPHLVAEHQEMVDLLGDLVRIESGSEDLRGLVEMEAALSDLFGGLGSLTRYAGHSAGIHHLVLELPGSGSADEPHVVVLGHFDTVWPRGTLERRPFTVDGHGLARAPGGFDMKGGLVLLVFALRALEAAGAQPRRTIRVVLNHDEEIGSLSSRELLANAATGACAALVLESPLPGGALKTARKGTGIYRLEISGRAAHSGIAPEEGASAVVELAHEVLALDRLNDYARGTTLNVGIVAGGSRLNVTPAQASADISIRAVDLDEADRLDAAIRSLRPVVPGTSLTVTAGPARPPMVSTPESRRLFELSRSVAAQIGVPDLRDGSTGGGSDGNLVAAMGVPTLDGLGPEGGGAHAEDEHVLTTSLPTRAALLAGLVAGLSC